MGNGLPDVVNPDTGHEIEERPDDDGDKHQHRDNDPFVRREGISPAATHHAGHDGFVVPAEAGTVAADPRFRRNYEHRSGSQRRVPGKRPAAAVESSGGEASGGGGEQ